MLALDKLENRRDVRGKVTARCPACQEAGGDRTGNHLAYWPESGKFACAAHPGDKPHRQRIWQLAGVPDHEKRSSFVRPTRAQILLRRSEAALSRHRRSIAAAARDHAARIFTMDWEDADLWHHSPIRLEGAEPDWHLLLTTLYPPDAVLWMGHPHESGPGHESHFQTRDHWLHRHPDTPPCPFICPDVFQPGVCHRSAASVAASPYLVVEADEALGHKPATAIERAENLRRNLCILRWLHETLAWPLRAIIHTGGKSCHGWFQRPGDTALHELKALAPALGIDASVFAPAHPVRLPGVVHEKTGVKSRLLYLS